MNIKKFFTRHAFYSIDEFMMFKNYSLLDCQLCIMNMV